MKQNAALSQKSITSKPHFTSIPTTIILITKIKLDHLSMRNTLHN